MSGNVAETARIFARLLKVKNDNIRELLGEFAGTFILVIFVTAAGLQNVLSPGSLGNPMTAFFGGAMGVTMGFFMCGSVSGGSMNPCISLTLVLTGRKPWIRLPFHCVGQLLGTFVSVSLLYLVYKDALDAFDGGNRALFGANGTGALFASFPQDFVSATSGFVDSAVSSGLLVICALAIVDPRNTNPPVWFYPFSIGMIVFVIVSGFALNCGAAINPAKDLGSRVFLWMAGWGREVFSFRNYNWFWIPVIAPLVGTVLACFLYWILIENHWPEEKEKEESNGNITKNGSASTAQEVSKVGHLNHAMTAESEIQGTRI